MPVRPNPLLGGAPATSTRSNPLLAPEPDTTRETATTEPEESSFPWGKALLGGSALAALGLITHSASAPKSLTQAGEFANSVRQQSMLSGLAPVKSFLGNIGAAVEQSLLRQDLAPLREFLSPTTMKAAITEYRANPVPPGATKFPDWLPTPGRIMQSLDTATQGALSRAGLSPEEAQAAVLQAPLPPRLQKALDSPIGRFLVPFRRTPFNQFIEGFDRLRAATDAETPLAQRLVTGGYVGAGAAHGYSTADQDRPLSVPLAISLAGTHSVPYALGAMGGRVLRGDEPNVTDTATSILPVSEYGLAQSVEHPFAPYTDPAALRALKELIGR